MPYASSMDSCQMLKTIFRILFPLFLGTILFFSFVQQNQNIQNYISVRLSRYLKENLNIEIEFLGFKANFFAASIFSEKIKLKLSSKEDLDLKLEKTKLQLLDLVKLFKRELSCKLAVDFVCLCGSLVKKSNSFTVENLQMNIQSKFNQSKSINFYGKFDLPFLKNKNFIFDGQIDKENKFLKCRSQDDFFCSVFYFSDYAIRGDLEIKPAGNSIFIGKATWLFDGQQGTIVAQNKNDLFFLPSNFGIVKKGDCKINLDFDFEKICGSYLAKLSDRKNSKLKFATKGFLSFKDWQLILKGRSNISSYLIEFNCLPELHISKLLLFKNKKLFVDLKISDNSNKNLQGQISSDFIKRFLPQDYKRLFLTNKLQFDVEFSQNNLAKIQGRIGFKNGKFYIPNNFNLIESVDSNFVLYPKAKEIKFNDLSIGFHKGSLFCDQAIIRLDRNFAVDYVHGQIKVYNLLVNIDRDFYGFIYGKLLVFKKEGRFFELNGNLTLKKSVMKDNFLSNRWENDEISYIDFLNLEKILLKVDINLCNEQPIKIRTDFLNGEANLDMNVKKIQLKNGAEYYQFLGDLDFEKGELNFLQNKLYIEDCKIEFIPNKVQDPSIRLTAKNKIKKYFITMKIDGVLKQMNYNFESSPELTEEQILALLMAGSENASFQTDLPAILLQNLNDWVTENKNTKGKGFFKKITLPFKYIQITPDFADQSGRGGIKGTVSVVLNEQLHAKIQKNFNLQEDFAFQIEYFLTDDVNLKVVKDQRGDLGSEVELRFKF